MGYTVALTGGIGSGKSTVLNWLKEKNISNSFILLKGSRATEMEKVLEYLEA